MDDAGTQFADLGASRQTTVENLSGHALSLDECSVNSAQAETLISHLSAMGQVHGERLEAQASAIGALQAQSVSMRGSAAGAVQAEQITVSGSAAGTVLSNEVNVKGDTTIGLLIARQVNGTVRPLLDLRGVLFLGLVIGLVLTLATRKQNATQGIAHRRPESPLEGLDDEATKGVRTDFVIPNNTARQFQPSPPDSHRLDLLAGSVMNHALSAASAGRQGRAADLAAAHLDDQLGLHRGHLSVVRPR